MFLGEDVHTLDGKGRVVMPSRFRERLTDSCIVTKGQDGQLVVFPRATWEQKAADAMHRPQNRAGRQFARTFFASADEQSLDKTGRLLVKPELRGYASLESGSEVVVLGVYDHVELWNVSSYESDRAAGDEAFLEDDDEEVPQSE
ncbi:MAG: division/cell wall cluster transcriptional repressor MraZ [Acidimicrobiia bacterium]